MNPTLLAAALLFFASPVFAAPLPLPEAVREGEAQSPVLQKAASALEESKWRRTESLSGFLPTVSASASYLLAHKWAVLDYNLGGAALEIPNIMPTGTYGASAHLPIFDGLANVDHYQAANDFVKSGQYDFDWTRFELDRNIVLLYYKALGARLLQDVAAQNVSALEDHLRDAELFKKAGIATNYDLLRVEVQVSEAKSDLLDATDNISVAKQNLAEAIGKPFEDRDLVGNLPVLKPEILQSLVGRDNEANDQGRLDLQSMRAKVSAYDKLEGAAGAYLVPRVYLFGDYSRYNNLNNRVWPSDPGYRDAYDVGIGLSWNIFDGAASLAKAKEAVEQRFQAEKTLESAQLRARRDLQLWQRKYLYYCNVYGARINDVDKAKESVRLARAGRKVGARTTTDLLDAESDLYRAQAGMVNAQLGAIESLINVELATGHGFYNFY